MQMSDTALLEWLVLSSGLCGICIGGFVWEFAHWLSQRKRRSDA